MRFTFPARAAVAASLLFLPATAVLAQGGLASLVAVGAQNLYITPSSVPTTFDGAAAPCSIEGEAPLVNQISGPD